MNFNRLVICLVIVLLTFTAGVRAEAWKFGVMGDTQWTCPNDPAGKNPDSVPKSIIEQVNKRFIEAGVKFVIQVGDLSNSGTDSAEKTRAQVAQPLYDANIGFFPMRGNHEVSSRTPNGYGVAIFKSDYPQTRGISRTFGVTDFSSPAAVSEDLNGLSYSFDYGEPCNNARFVILDDWATPDRVVKSEFKYGYSFGRQQPWLGSRLDVNSRGTVHAFVFSHQPLIQESHQDSPFFGDANANTESQNVFFTSLQSNGVKYYISGHDHIHHRAIITSPDGNSSVEQLICASCSSKFYTPKDPNDPKWYGRKARQKSLSPADVKRVGFYIFTIDGPRVTADYYADDHGSWQSDAKYPNGSSAADNQVTPVFNFVKKETWGYELKGN
jgi:hypothetical protein